MKSIYDKYSTFFKYIFSSGICYIVDLLFFAICIKLLANVSNISYILISTFCARLIPSFINLIINKNKIFKKNNINRKDNFNICLTYYCLVIIQIIISSILTEIVYKLTNLNLILIKFIIDFVILFVNYFIQSKFIFNNKFINFINLGKSLIAFVKENKLITIILLISLVLHIACTLTVGVNYSLYSDDESYIKSGIYFKNHLTIIMNDVKSAQIMPGMTYLIAFISYLTGEGFALMLCLKILWMIMGLLSILGIYKIVRLFSNKIFSSIAACFLLVIDFIWMDNLILTETPFMFGFIFLIYSSLMLANTKKAKYFYQIVGFYLFCVLLKANIAPYPLFLIIYLLFKKYDLKTLSKQLLISFAILCVFFIPWIIRNYIVFNRFIPLTYGSGNPLLLGTYQGYNYPSDDEDAYNEYIKQNASSEMQEYLDNSRTDKPYMRKFYSLERDGLIAKYRMKQWWNTDKLSMIKSYLLYKPYVNIYCTFYWDTIWNIPSSLILKIRAFDIILTLICGISILINKKYIKELLFLSFNYIFQILVYSYTFAFDRYGQTLLFIRFIIIGIGLNIIYNFIKKLFKFLYNKKIQSKG